MKLIDTMLKFEKYQTTAKVRGKVYRKYHFTAKVKYWTKCRGYDEDRLLLINVKLGKLLFRDHVYIKKTKRNNHLKKGDYIFFNACVVPYIDSSDINKYKLGLRQMRNIKIRRRK